jgi:hypothetical protein
MLPAAGLPIRLRPGLSRRRSSACTLPGPAAGVRRPSARPGGGLGNNEGDRGHPSERPRGPGPVQKGMKASRSDDGALLSSLAIPSLSPLAARVCQYAPQAGGPFTCIRSRV